MAQVTIDMCNYIIEYAERGESFPLTVNELSQLAHSFIAAHAGPGGGLTDDDIIKIFAEKGRQKIDCLEVSYDEALAIARAIEQRVTGQEPLVNAFPAINQAMCIMGGLKAKELGFDNFCGSHAKQVFEAMILAYEKYGNVPDPVIYCDGPQPVAVPDKE
jgi:hypothetical protein